MSATSSLTSKPTIVGNAWSGNAAATVPFPPGFPRWFEARSAAKAPVTAASSPGSPSWRGVPLDITVVIGDRRLAAAVGVHLPNALVEPSFGPLIGDAIAVWGEHWMIFRDVAGVGEAHRARAVKRGRVDLAGDRRLVLARHDGPVAVAVADEHEAAPIG